MALIDSIGGGVAWVSRAPVCLCFLADRLAFVITAGALARYRSRIRIKPPSADPAGALPGLGMLLHQTASLIVNFGGQLLASRGGQLFASAEASRDASPVQAPFFMRTGAGGPPPEGGQLSEPTQLTAFTLNESPSDRLSRVCSS